MTKFGLKDAEHPGCFKVEGFFDFLHVFRLKRDSETYSSHLRVSGSLFQSPIVLGRKDDR